MKKILNKQEKNIMELEDPEFALKCILNLIKIRYQELEKDKNSNLSHSIICYDEGVISGLKSSYYYLTGQDLNDDKIKELTNDTHNVND